MHALRCPKCDSSAVTVERDLWGPSNDGLILSCGTCGKKLYGRAAAQEIEWQKKQGPKAPTPRQVQSEKARKLAEANEIANRVHANYLKKRRQKLAAQEAAKRDEIRAWLAMKAVKGIDGPKLTGSAEAYEAAAREGDFCAWHNCNEMKLEGRKYCSTVCRKRQARWNYREKQKKARG